MLKHSSEPADRSQRSGKATAVIPLDSANSCARPAVPISAPTLTRRMRHNRPRSGISASVFLFGPELNVRQPCIGTIWHHEKGCNLQLISNLSAR